MMNKNEIDCVEASEHVIFKSMNRKSIIAIGVLSTFAITSCTTTYDAYGRPVQSVDPGTAAVGVVAAGLLGAAIADNNNDGRHHRHHRRGYDRRHYRHHGYYR